MCERSRSYLSHPDNHVPDCVDPIDPKAKKKIDHADPIDMYLSVQTKNRGLICPTYGAIIIVVPGMLFYLRQKVPTSAGSFFLAHLRFRPSCACFPCSHSLSASAAAVGSSCSK